ncbi:MAG: hypothetical protein KBC58_09595 [Flavobacterium sp.]|nr:hypothetical protein [Flavobacterium sp.]
MTKNIKPHVKSLKEKTCVFLVIIGMSSVIYFIATSLTEKRMEEISFINQNFETTRGIITKKSVYKGHNIRVKYKVNGIIYENSDGFNVNDNIQEGDSINLKYSKTKPELMITEFNEEY